MSGILDISFLCARIPFQRLTCYSFCKSAVQPLPRTFLKNRRAFVLSLHISRSTFGRSIISEESQKIHKRQTRECFYISSRSREIRSFVKRELQYGSLGSNVENGFIMSLTRILRSDVREILKQLSLRRICQFFEAGRLQQRNNITYHVSSRSSMRHYIDDYF